MRTLCLATGSLLAVVALTAGCARSGDATHPSATAAVSSATTAPNVYEQERSAGAQRALDELSAAITSGSDTRLDGVLDAAASPPFRDRLHTAATNFAVHGQVTDPAASSIADRAGVRGTALRLKEFHYQLAPTDEAETLVPSALQSRLDAEGSSDSWVAPVELHYALGGAVTPGVDEPEVTVPTQLVLARYGDAWKVVGDATAAGGSPTPTGLWELPGLAATDVRSAGGDCSILSYPGTAATVARVGDLLPAAVAAVTDFWGTGWPRRAVVIATGRPAEFTALTQSSTADDAGAAAAAIVTRVDSDTRTAVGQRVVLTPGAGEMPAPTLAEVLRHELTHVATRVDTSPSAPLWITEGVAEYVGRKGTYIRFDDAAPNLADRLRAGQVPAGLPADGDFAVDADAALVAYQSAWSVAAYVADRYGEARLKKLYLGVAASGDIRRQDAAIDDALCIDRNRLVTDWRSWLTEQVR